MVRPSLIWDAPAGAGMGKLKPGWLYDLMQENKEECKNLSQWQKDLTKKVLRHDDDE